MSFVKGKREKTRPEADAQAVDLIAITTGRGKRTADEKAKDIIREAERKIRQDEIEKARREAER